VKAMGTLAQVSHPAALSPPGNDLSSAVMAAATPSLTEKLAYSCGDLSSNLLWGISGSFLLYYYTETLQLAASSIAVLLLVTRIADAFADPLVGYWIDRSGGRLVRPLLKWLAMPFGIIGFLVFLPISTSSRVNLGWAYLSYLAFGLIYAAINTPYGVLQNIMTTDPRSRVSLAGFRMLGCQLGTLGIYLFTLPVIHWIGGGSARHNELIGFPIYMAFVGLIGAILWLITYAGCKPRYAPEASRHTIAELLAALRHNRPWLICTAAFTLSFVILCCYLSFAIYYAQYVLHKDAEYGGRLLVLFTLCALGGNLSCAAPWMVRFQNKSILQAGYLLQTVALVGIGASPQGTTIFLTLFSIASFASGLGSPLYYAMIADSIDHGTQATGVRTAGMGYALNSLLQKAAFGVTGALLAEFLSLGSYPPDSPAQAEGLSRWITAGFIWLPAAVSALIAVLVAFYPSTTMSCAASETRS
jgi:GPH family glycoside/pentoside/hexuronide:cation symporter